MAKIPLERSIGGAYRFLFSNFPSILGIVWLPYLLFGGAAAALVWYGTARIPLAALSFDPKYPNLAPLFAFLRLVPGVIVLIVLAELIATLGLTRKALGLMPGPTYFFFEFGAPLWRLVGAVIIVWLIVVGVVTAFVTIGALFAAYGKAVISSDGMRILAGTLGVIAMVLWTIYMIFRLVFFISAVVVVERRVGVGRSWSLGRGNFWRIFIVLLMVALPPAIASGLLNSIVSTLLYGPMPMPPFAGNPHPDPQQVIAYWKLILGRIGPAIIAIQILYAICVRALYAGAVATAYRDVTSGSAPPA